MNEIHKTGPDGSHYFFLVWDQMIREMMIMMMMMTTEREREEGKEKQRRRTSRMLGSK